MFNIKWSGIAGIFGFLLSLLLGFISRAGLLGLIRAVVFGVVFFILGSAIYTLLSKFLPELLGDVPQDDGPGTRIDISLGDDMGSITGIDGYDGLSALMDGNGNDGSPGSGGGNPGAALDQQGEDGYTTNTEGGDDDGEPPLPGDFSDESGPAGEGESALSELENISGDFGSSAQSGGAMEPRRPVSFNTGQNVELKGDYKPKEIAQAIQTILKREKD
jgi:hypothetical protein